MTDYTSEDMKKIHSNYIENKKFQWTGKTYEDYLDYLELMGIGVEYADRSYDDDTNIIALSNTLCGQGLVTIKPNQYLCFNEKNEQWAIEVTND